MDRIVSMLVSVWAMLIANTAIGAIQDDMGLFPGKGRFCFLVMHSVPIHANPDK